MSNKIKVNWTQIKNVLVADAVYPPEKKDAFAPAFGERWIKDGFVWEACESAKRNEHTCSICDYNKHCGEMVCRLFMYVKKIGPAYTPGVFTDCKPCTGSLTGPERQTRIFEVYTHAESRLLKFHMFNEGSFPVCEAHGMEGFAGYEVQLHDGTKHIVAYPIVYANDEGEFWYAWTDEYRHISTLTGVAFLEDE